MPSGRKPAVAVLSSQAGFREQVGQLVTTQGFGPVVEHDDKAKLSAQPIDILIIDLDYEPDTLMHLVQTLRESSPGMQIILFAAPGATPLDPEVDREALVGALVHGFRAAAGDKPPHRNWSRITSRQRDVMRWLAAGLDNATIGQKLRIGERAVKAHISSLLALFGLDNRTQLALLADRAGMRPPRR